MLTDFIKVPIREKVFTITFANNGSILFSETHLKR